MLILNLNNEEESPLGYERILYPDNQVSIKLDEVELAAYGDGEVQIRSRFNDYEEMMYLFAATDVLHHTHSTGKRIIHLSIPCFLGQRSDRRFSDGQSNDLAIIVGLFADQGYTSVELLHTHSSVLPALFEAHKIKPILIANDKLVTFMLKTIKREGLIEPKDVVFVSPDAGAYTMVHNLGEKHNIAVIPANKVRDTKGAHIEVSGNVKDKVCIVIDDYCDGGTTPIKTAQALKLQGATQVVICITHFLASKGLEPLLMHIDRIFTTNSIKEIDHEKVEQLKII